MELHCSRFTKSAYLPQVICLSGRLIRARQPQRPAQIVRSRRRTGFAEPAFVDFVGLVGVNEDVAVLVIGAGFGDADFLVPTMLAADEIGLHRKS